MVAHVAGPAGGPPPPTCNETLLQAEIDRLRIELDGLRGSLRRHHAYLDGLTGHACLICAHEEANRG